MGVFHALDGSISSVSMFLFPFMSAKKHSPIIVLVLVLGFTVVIHRSCFLRSNIDDRFSSFCSAFDLQFFCVVENKCAAAITSQAKRVVASCLVGFLFTQKSKTVNNSTSFPYIPFELLLNIVTAKAGILLQRSVYRNFVGIIVLHLSGVDLDLLFKTTFQFHLLTTRRPERLLFARGVYRLDSFLKSHLSAIERNDSICETFQEEATKTFHVPGSLSQSRLTDLSLNAVFAGDHGEVAITAVRIQSHLLRMLVCCQCH